MATAAPPETFKGLRQRWDAAAKALLEEEAKQAAAAPSPNGTPLSSTAAEDAQDRAAQVRFKAKHAIWLGVLAWTLFVHVVGLGFFTKGFLLTRLVLDETSTCAAPPVALPNNAGCWRRSH